MTRGLTLTGYVVLFIAIVGYEILARRRHTATLGDVVTMATSRRIGKGLLLAGWLWLGWHLFVRVSD